MTTNENIRTILADMRNALLAKKEVLSVKDLSVYTGLSKSTIYKLTFDRLIPHYKPGGKLIFFNRKEIDAWLQSNRVSKI